MEGVTYRKQVLREESGPDFAVAAASIHSQRLGQGVRLSTRGLPRVSIHVEGEDVSAWPTSLVLTVRRANLAGAGAALGTPVTIGAFGVTTVTDAGGVGEVEVVVTTVSSGGHGRIRVGVVVGRA